MKFKEVKSQLEKFADYVIDKARKDLERDNKGGGPLANSLDKEIIQEKNAFLVQFIMEDYGKFVDKGVKGANPSLVKNGRQKAPNSPYSYKQKMPPMEPLSLWAKSKNIRFRDAKGRFARGNYKTIGFWLQKRIFAQGLSPSLFFDKAFDMGIRKYADELLNAYALDVENEIILGIKK